MSSRLPTPMCVCARVQAPFGVTVSGIRNDLWGSDPPVRVGDSVLRIDDRLVSTMDAHTVRLRLLCVRLPTVLMGVHTQFKGLVTPAVNKVFLFEGAP